MAYDVFLVSAVGDRDIAKVVARRLRALKFKVWFDAKQTDDTFDQKDARNALNSQSMLVLWSEKAVESDFVRAAASVGNSKDGMLLQAGLDKTKPYEPFKLDTAYSLAGMTSRTIPDGFYEIVEELGRRDGRIDLREWMGFTAKDEAQKAAWLRAHPTDPLAEAAKKAKARSLASKPKPAAEAAGAAALAANSLKSHRPAEPRVVASQPTSAAAAAAAAIAARRKEQIDVGLSMLIPIAVGILIMFWLSYLLRSETATPTALPAISNAQIFAPATCPAGTIDRAKLAPPLDAGYSGRIIVDEDE